MKNALMPVNRPGLSQKPYTPEKPKGAKAMTVAIGLSCNEGRDLVIASDRQFTVEGFSKDYAKKLVSNGPSIVYGFAGDPGLYIEARQKIKGFLDTVKPEDSSVDVIRQTVEGVVTQMGVRSNDPNYRPLYLFIGVNEIFDRPSLIVFNGQGVYVSEDGFEVIGCGDTSVINFLRKHLYSPRLSREQGIGLAAYLIKKATLHVDKTGGTVDVEWADGVGFQTVSSEIVEDAINRIEEQEEYLSILMIQKPFQL
jgi:20S proteasome alpha/beta subunit